MIELARQAGFLAAHAVWCVSDGEPLVPLVGEARGQEHEVRRFAAETLEEGVAQAQAELAGTDSDRAVLIYDGYLTIGENRLDSLILEAKTSAGGRLQMAVPYRPLDSDAGFAVYKPKFLALEGHEPDWEELGSAFFDGVHQHEKGAAVWNEHLDESL